MVNVVVILFYLLFRNDRQKATKVKCKRNESFTKQSILSRTYSPLEKRLSFAGAHSQKITRLYHNRPGETLDQTNLISESHDYRICNVNIDLHHQYRISVAEL